MSVAIESSAAAITEPAARKPVLTEYVGVVVFFVLMGVLASHIRDSFATVHWAVLVGSLAFGYVMSDFTSGFVHWLFDTWGSPDTPVVGKTFIVPFRIHHSDAKDITRHGFIATNGHNCFVSLPILGAACFLPFEQTWAGAMLCFVVALTFGVFLTNQFHKWSHLDAPGPVVDFLQRHHVILPRDHHDKHHHAPYATNYCITTGWLNAPLNRIGFFPAVERLITRVTGVHPRVDDLKTA